MQLTYLESGEYENSVLQAIGISESKVLGHSSMERLKDYECGKCGVQD